MKHLLLPIFTVAFFSTNAQCSFNTSITVVGDTIICEGTSTQLSVDETSDSWTQKNNFGGMARKYGVAFSINDKGYVGTGDGGSGNKKDFWQYDPVSDSWSQMADFAGTARFNAVGFSIGAMGYIGTGNDNSGATSDFWAYNPNTNSWQQKASFPFPRIQAVGLSIGNRGYIGMGGSGNITDFWEYNPNTDNWTQKANIQNPRYGSFSFSIGNRGYVGGGYVNVGFGFGVSDDVWEYNPSNNTWTQKANLPNGYYAATAKAFSIGNLGYIGTGALPPGNTNNLTNMFIEYNPTTNTWTPRANVGGQVRFGATAFSIGGRGYMCGGQDNSFTLLNDVWEYTPTISSCIWSNADQNFTTTVSTGGLYSATLTSVTGCTAVAFQTIEVRDCINSLRETNASGFQKLKIVPNPCSTAFTLQAAKEGRYFIYNALAAKIMTIEIKEGVNTINVEHLAAGVYFISDGEQQEKIIILAN